MRTKKKNESGILNQNICGSNEGYRSYREGDLKGGGYTYANVAYPGKRYNRGSVFREKDMGNLIQLFFICGDYFRFKNIEFVTDSHFGHLVPVLYLTLWKILVTSSFRVSRVGVKQIERFSKEKLSESQREILLRKLAQNKEPSQRRSLLELGESDSESDNSLSDSAETKFLKKAKTQLDFFEKEMGQKAKGTIKVWQSIHVLSGLEKD